MTVQGISKTSKNSRRVQVYLTLAASTLLLLSSCFSTGKSVTKDAEEKPPLEEALLARNSVAAEGYHLSLPPGWRFTSDTDAVGSKTILLFHKKGVPYETVQTDASFALSPLDIDEENEMSGKYEVTDLKKMKVPAEKTLYIYKEIILENWRRKRESVHTIGEKEFYIVRAEKEDGSHTLCRTAYFTFTDSRMHLIEITARCLASESRRVKKAITSSYFTDFEGGAEFSRAGGHAAGSSTVEIRNGVLHLRAYNEGGAHDGVHSRFTGDRISRGSEIYFRARFAERESRHPYAHFKLLHNYSSSLLVIIVKPNGINAFVNAGGSTRHQLFSPQKSYPFSTGKWYNIRLKLGEDLLTVYINGNYLDRISIPSGLGNSGSFEFECHNEYEIDDFGYFSY